MSDYSRLEIPRSGQGRAGQASCKEGSVAIDRLGGEDARIGNYEGVNKISGAFGLAVWFAWIGGEARAGINQGLRLEVRLRS